MELPIRIIEGGEKLTLSTKKFKLIGNELNPKQIESVCSIIGNHYGISTAPNYLSTSQEILICSSQAIKTNKISLPLEKSNEEWIIKLENNGETNLIFSEELHRDLMADLFRRELILRVASKKNLFWRISDSNRIFYDLQPLITSGNENEHKDIDAFRSYKLSDIIIEKEGIGFSLAIGTSYISKYSIEYYFKNKKWDRFEELRQRSKELKGTLLFRAPKRINKVYFERLSEEYTCGTVPEFFVRNKKYKNLVDYYSIYPEYNIKDGDMIAYVSFPNMGAAKPVPAKKLRVRIFSDAVPSDMKDINKLSPEERKKESIQFWEKIGRNIFGYPFKNFKKSYFFSPSKEQYGTIKLPNLVFGKNNNNNIILSGPDKVNHNEYRQNFWDRKTFLKRYGCYYVPPTVEREIYFPFPPNISNHIREKFAHDICQEVSALIKENIVEIIEPYSHYLQAAYSLKKNKETGMVVFTFDNSLPSTYFNISRELQDWSIKRITSDELLKKFNIYSYNKKSRLVKGEKRLSKGEKDWDTFIEVCAFDIIQQMGCIPWTLEKPLNYDIHLAIDVSEDRTHFALSLMIFNTQVKYPIFKTVTVRKLDEYMETINEEDLKEELIKLFTDAECKELLKEFDSCKLLAYRDGKVSIGEYNALKNSIDFLKKERILPKYFTFDFVEYRKKTIKSLKGWHSNSFQRQVRNLLEGSYWLKTSKSAILWSTGAATISQATADPIQIEMKYTNGNIIEILTDIFNSAQFNFSNPIKAQKLSMPLKRADEKLKEKRAEEIKLR